jgi:hypothetical protein
MNLTYVLKTKRGDPWMTFDRLDRAEAVRAERASRGIPLRLVEQKLTERELP